jgi:hypothetical protein
MKIKVKETKVIETEVTIGRNISKDDKHFQDVIDYLKTLEFLATSCSHNYFASFPSTNQGGNNTYNLTDISILEENGDKLVVKVWWMDNTSAYIIFKLP